jgi:hypothetical protein
MKKVNNALLFFLILFLVLNLGCSKQSKNSVVSDLDVKNKKGINLNKEELAFNFFDEKASFLKVLTKNEFSKYSLTFTPVGKKSPENPLSILIRYRDENNYCRLNIFLDTGKVHLYQKAGKSTKNLLYSQISNFSQNFNNNIFNIRTDADKLSLRVNENILFSGSIEIKKGKIGAGAYGKKGDTAKFIFRNF